MLNVLTARTEVAKRRGIPSALKDNPRDKLGFILPFSAFMDPEDFARGKAMRVVDDSFNVAVDSTALDSDICWKMKCCGLCGKDLDKEMVAVSYDAPIKKSVLVGDPIMRRECFEYSLAACPVLRGTPYEPGEYIEDATRISKLESKTHQKGVGTLSLEETIEARVAHIESSHTVPFYVLQLSPNVKPMYSTSSEGFRIKPSDVVSFQKYQKGKPVALEAPESPNPAIAGCPVHKGSAREELGK